MDNEPCYTTTDMNTALEQQRRKLTRITVTAEMGVFTLVFPVISIEDSGDGQLVKVNIADFIQ